MKSITLPASLRRIGPFAFQMCSSLVEITIPDGVSRIDGSAFFSCANLKSVTLPASVTEIGNSAFYQPMRWNSMNGTSYTLRDVYYHGLEAMRENIRIGSSNDALLAAEWHYLDPSDSYTALRLPEALRVVEAQALIGSTAEMIIVPASVAEIGPKAFAYCRELRLLVFEGDPVTIAEDAMAGSSKAVVRAASGSHAAQWAAAAGFAVIDP